MIRMVIGCILAMLWVMVMVLILSIVVFTTGGQIVEAIPCLIASSVMGACGVLLILWGKRSRDKNIVKGDKSHG